MLCEIGSDLANIIGDRRYMLSEMKLVINQPKFCAVSVGVNDDDSCWMLILCGRAGLGWNIRNLVELKVSKLIYH